MKITLLCLLLLGSAVPAHAVVDASVNTNAIGQISTNKDTSIWMTSLANRMFALEKKQALLDDQTIENKKQIKSLSTWLLVLVTLSVTMLAALCISAARTKNRPPPESTAVLTPG